MTIDRPAADEYDAYYAGYVDEVPDGPILETLERQVADTVELLSGLSDAQAAYRYKPGKWSLKEVVGHVIDAERLFAYRALSFARNDPAELPGMDQDDWVVEGRFQTRSLSDLLDELRHLRRANVRLFSSFDEEVLSRRGTASGYQFTVRALLYIIAGHELHHQRVLRERYL